MGVNGLLPFLKKCTRRVNLKDFKGYTVAIDAYCWIHRASYSCAMDIALGNPTTQYINYCLRYLKMTTESGVRPILVFDGSNLPAKAETEKKRRNSKKMYKERAAQYLLEGNKKAAQECFERCVDVTPQMARAVMKAARNFGVDCIVAPYESDAQLAYLVQAGYADIVITEDSDLLMFGCKQVIFKLDLTGFGDLITWSAGIGELCCGVPSQDFSPSSLRFMGILSGCDYFPGIPRIGLVTAAKIIRQCRTMDFRYILSNLGNFCNLSESACQPFTSPHGNCSPFADEGSSLSSTSIISVKTDSKMFSKKNFYKNKLHEYTIRAAMRAERTFRLQVVFDPRTRRRLRLSEPTLEDIREERLTIADADLPDEELFLYAGDCTLDSDQAFDIALGNVDFETGKRVDSFNPDEFKVKKLFGELGLHSDVSLQLSKQRFGLISNSEKPILKKACRPDGDRLNVSVWNSAYRLEPVWIYYTDIGTRSIPYCISAEGHSANPQTSVLLHLSATEKSDGEQNTKICLLSLSTDSLHNLPKFRESNASRNHGAAEGLIEHTPSDAQKGSLDEVIDSDVFVKDILACYASDTDHLTPKTPLKPISRDMPITSAGSYFASPVSAAIPMANNATSPIFHCKRMRTSGPDSVRLMSDRKNNIFACPKNNLAFANKTVSANDETRNAQMNSPVFKNYCMVKHEFGQESHKQASLAKRRAPLALRDPFFRCPWRADRELAILEERHSNNQEDPHKPTSRIPIQNDKDEQKSPVDQTGGFDHVKVNDKQSRNECTQENLPMNLSSFFRRWQFSPKKKNPTT